MIEITCYELQYPVAGNDYFNGGRSNEREWATECFLTKESAEEKRHTIMKEYRKGKPYPKWWAEKYAYDDELAIITRVIKRL